MNVKVHTYSQPKGWAQHPQYASFSDAIHICATNNQRKGIKECYGQDLKHIYSFREFIKSLYPYWYSAETKFQQFLRLSAIIANLTNISSELKQAFRLNVMDILDSIRFFVEANIKPLALRDCWLNTEKERIFKSVWTNFINTDIASQRHYQTLNRPILKTSIRKAIIKLSNETDIQFKDDVHIVLHGFYFVTPEQQILLEIFRKQQIQITFFQYFDSRYPNTFDFVKAFVTERFGWPPPEKWIYDTTDPGSISKSARKFLSAYENNTYKSEELEETIIGYESFFDFLHDVILPQFPIGNEQDNKTITPNIISPNAKQLNEMILSYYPELSPKKRNFLSYPIGRFLVSLHQIYNNGQFNLTEEILTDLFSSGWLSNKTLNNNAQDYTHDLHLLFPYLVGCTEINSWITRLEKLIQQALIIEKAFPINLENRIIRSMRSPFSKISHFSIPLDRIKQVKMFIENIRTITEALFDRSESNTIDTHFKRLKDILKIHGHGVSFVADENEKILIQELEHKLDLIQDNSEFFYDDIQTALHFYLSGKLDDEDENYINGFIEIDGEMFKSHQNHTIYLTGLDENSLPLGGQNTPWPLQSETFELLSEEHTALELHTIRSRANKSISRYLFFIALNLSPQQLKLSWIKNIMDKDEMQPALYIKQLSLQAISFNGALGNTEDPLPLYDFSQEIIDPNEVAVVWQTLGFEDFLAEYKSCPKRFYYSYITDEYPTFSNDFIHQFMFSEIVRFVRRSINADYESVLEEVSPLFPQWLDFKKQFSVKKVFEFGLGRPGEKTAVSESYSYTKARKNFQFPGFKTEERDNLYDETRSSVECIIKEIEASDNQVMTAHPGYACRFCPHIDYCNDAIFPVDLRKEN